MIKLGDTKEEAITSLQQLVTWGSNAKKKDYINITEENGVIITIYRYTNSQSIISFGDAEYCQEIYKSLMMSAFTGVNTGAYSNNNPPFGYCQDSLLEKALKKLQE